MPISDEGKPYYLAGALLEASEFYERTGAFKALIQTGTAPLSNGKTAVDCEAGLNEGGRVLDFARECGGLYQPWAAVRPVLRGGRGERPLVR